MIRKIRNSFTSMLPNYGFSFPTQILGPILLRGGTMVSARLAALVLGAGGSIWAARCLGPANLGLSGFILGFGVQIVLALSVMHQTILVREYKHAADNVARDEMLTAATTFFFLSSLLAAAAIVMLLALGLIPQPYAPLCGFLIVLVFSSAMQPLWVFQATEKQHFQSAIAIAQPALQGLLYCVLLRPGMGAGMDLAINAAVTTIIALIYWFTLYRMKIIKGLPLSGANIGKIRRLLCQSRWYFMIAVAVYIYTMLELPLVGWLRSLPEMGQFRTAFTLTAAAKSLFEIVPTIFYPRFLEWRREDEELLWRRQLQLTLVLMPLGLLGCVAALVVTPRIYDLLYGPAFMEAAVPCVILVCSKFVVVINGIFFWGLATDPAFDRKIASWMVAIAVFSLASNLLLIPTFGMLGAASVDLASELAILIVCWTLAFRRIRCLREGNVAHAL